MTMHRPVRYRAVFAAAALVLLFALAPPRPAHAQLDGSSCFRLGDNVVVQPGEEMACDLFVVGGDIRLEPGSLVDGDVVLFGGDLEVAGDVRGDVSVAGGGAAVDGEVEGNVFASDFLDIGPEAEIGGDASSLGRVESSDSAVVRGRVTEMTDDPYEESGGFEPGALIFPLGAVLLAALFAGLMTLLFPRMQAAVRDAAAGSARDVVVSTGVGLLLMLVFPLLALLLVITIVGPFLLTAAYGIGFALGSVAIGEALGARILRRGSRLWQAVLGTALLSSLIWGALFLLDGQLVCGAFLLGLFLLAWSLGAAAMALLRSRASRADAGAPSEGGSEAPEEAALGTLNDTEAEGGASMGPGGKVAAAAGVGAISVDAAAGDDADDVDTAAEPASSSSTELDDPPTAAAAARVDADEDSAAGPVPDEAGTVPPAAEAAEPARSAADEANDHDASEDDVRASAIRAGASDGAESDADAKDDALLDEDAAGDVDESPSRDSDVGDAAQGAPPSAPAAGDADEGLRAVPGISPIYALLLREAGIHDVPTLANTPPERVAEIVSVAGVVPVDLETARRWVQTARRLA